MDDTGTFHDKTDDPARAAEFLTKNAAPPEVGSARVAAGWIVS
ncbi:MAG: hypothetical protein RIB55_12325 [Nitratireductor sp.]